MRCSFSGEPPVLQPTFLKRRELSSQPPLGGGRPFCHTLRRGAKAGSSGCPGGRLPASALLCPCPRLHAGSIQVLPPREGVPVWLSWRKCVWGGGGVGRVMWEQRKHGESSAPCSSQSPPGSLTLEVAEMLENEREPTGLPLLPHPLGSQGHWRSSSSSRAWRPPWQRLLALGPAVSGLWVEVPPGTGWQLLLGLCPVSAQPLFPAASSDDAFPAVAQPPREASALAQGRLWVLLVCLLWPFRCLPGGSTSPTLSLGERSDEFPERLWPGEWEC